MDVDAISSTDNDANAMDAASSSLFPSTTSSSAAAALSSSPAAPVVSAAGGADHSADGRSDDSADDDDNDNDNTADDDEDDEDDASKGGKGKAKGAKGGVSQHSPLHSLTQRHTAYHGITVPAARSAAQLTVCPLAWCCQSSCHQCKSRRNEVALTYCTSLLDKKNKRCRKKVTTSSFNHSLTHSRTSSAGQPTQGRSLLSVRHCCCVCVAAPLLSVLRSLPEEVLQGEPERHH